MQYVQRADELFKKGYVCSQAVLAGFSQKMGLDHDVALRIAQGFGGGAGSQGLCGAVAGAHMVLSLSLEASPPDNPRKNRDKLYAMIKEFNQGFKAKHGSLHCVDLLGGLDLGNEQDYARARKEQVFGKTCPGYVNEAARLLETILPE